MSSGRSGEHDAAPGSEFRLQADFLIDVSSRIAYLGLTETMETTMKYRRTRDPMARDLRQPKYRPRVAPGKLEKLRTRVGRKAKHKGGEAA